MATIQYVPRYPYFVTMWGHRKIEPKAKHLSHCKKYQSSWPNQTDNSKRNTKIPNHAYKNSEKIQIIFIDKLIINPQYIGSRQTHRKRRLHLIDLQEHRGEHGIENQRERRIHLTTIYGPVGLSKLLMLHRKGNRVDVDALRDRIPLRQSTNWPPDGI